MKRNIITIDQEKCTGCGLCIPGCPEGAIQLIDGKARLISDLFCDGLGACLGHCPENAITIEERDAEPYNEARVMENIVKQGENTIKAHVKHLRDHNQNEFLNEALAYLEENNIQFNSKEEKSPLPPLGQGCTGTRNINFIQPVKEDVLKDETDQIPSALTHWPIQMHLLSPSAPHFQGADLLLAADCVAFSLGEFHRNYLHGKKLAIACPKLDEGKQIYIEKLIALIDSARINTLTVMVMQVPCCNGLMALAQQARKEAERNVPLERIVVGINGQILQEDWL